MIRNYTWLIANWKMNGDAARVRSFVKEINATLTRFAATKHVRGVVCVPMPYLAVASSVMPPNPRLALGAQNCHASPQGAYTGETSAAMLSDIGCSYVILGHSERRARGETNEEIRDKADAAISARLVPIICIGESLSAYEAKQTTVMLDQQMESLKSLKPKSFMIAYEPIWAIGSGLTPSATEIDVAHRHIKSTLGSETSVLYGGSVNPGNIKELLEIPTVEGALIGGASLEIKSMQAMIEACE